MRFTTIWTMPAMSLRERLSRTREELWRRAAHRLPRKLAYFSYIDSTAKYVKNDEIVPDVKAFDIMHRMEKPA